MGMAEVHMVGQDTHGQPMRAAGAARNHRMEQESAAAGHARTATSPPTCVRSGNATSTRTTWTPGHAFRTRSFHRASSRAQPKLSASRRTRRSSARK